MKPCTSHALCKNSKCYPPFHARDTLPHTWVYSRSDAQIPEGIGSMLQWRKPGLIYASAARVPFFGKLVNAHDGHDYAPFFGLGDPHCDPPADATAAPRRFNGSSYHLRHLSRLGPGLLRICRVIEAGEGPAALGAASDNILKDLLKRKLSPAGGAVAFPVDHVLRQGGRTRNAAHSSTPPLCRPFRSAACVHIGRPPPGAPLRPSKAPLPRAQNWTTARSVRPSARPLRGRARAVAASSSRRAHGASAESRTRNLLIPRAC